MGKSNAGSHSSSASTRTRGSTVSSSSTGSAIASNDAEYHATRLEQNRERLVTFEKQTKQLAELMNSENVYQTVQSRKALAEEDDIALGDAEDYTTATQSNLHGLSILYKARFPSSKRSLYVHALSLKTLSDEYRSVLNESLKILKHFASTRSSIRSTTGQKSYFLRVIDIFYLTSEELVLVAEDKFPLEYTMQYKLWNTAYIGYAKVTI